MNRNIKVQIRSKSRRGNNKPLGILVVRMNNVSQDTYQKTGSEVKEVLNRAINKGESAVMIAGEGMGSVQWIKL